MDPRRSPLLRPDGQRIATAADWSLERAAREVVQTKLKEFGGEGGIIAVDAKGNAALEFNSPGMFRGVRDSKGRREIAIYDK